MSTKADILSLATELAGLEKRNKALAVVELLKESGLKFILVVGADDGGLSTFSNIHDQGARETFGFLAGNYRNETEDRN